MLLNLIPSRPINLNKLKQAIDTKICAILNFLEDDANFAGEGPCQVCINKPSRTKNIAINTMDTTTSGNTADTRMNTDRTMKCETGSETMNGSQTATESHRMLMRDIEEDGQHTDQSNEGG
jgi:hypothetical protein